jgi:tRNA (guanine-N7-)-methyltransferase
MANTCRRRAQRLLITKQEVQDCFDPRTYFEKDKPLAIELGIGKGRFLRDWALKHPKWGVMGVEIKLDRANRAALKLEDEGLEKCFVVHSDVKEIFTNINSEAKFEAIHLNFPDPWPKARHAKHRLINPDFIDLYVKQLKRGGSLVFVTDDPNYALYGQKNLQDRDDLVDVFDGIRMKWPCYPVSIHEEKFRSWGRQIHYQKFMRKL